MKDLKLKRKPIGIVSMGDPRLERMDKRTKVYKETVRKLEAQQAEPKRNRAPHLIEGERKPRDNANRVHFVLPDGAKPDEFAQFMRDTGMAEEALQLKASEQRTDATLVPLTEKERMFLRNLMENSTTPFSVVLTIGEGFALFNKLGGQS